LNYLPNLHYELYNLEYGFITGHRACHGAKVVIMSHDLEVVLKSYCGLTNSNLNFKIKNHAPTTRLP